MPDGPDGMLGVFIVQVQQTTGKAKERRLKMESLLSGIIPLYDYYDHTNHIMLCTLCLNPEILQLKC